MKGGDWLLGALALSARRAAGPVSRVRRLFECSEWRAQIDDMETSLFAKWVRDELRALSWAGEDGVSWLHHLMVFRLVASRTPQQNSSALVAFPVGANS